jgi:hypothetical protein
MRHAKSYQLVPDNVSGMSPDAVSDLTAQTFGSLKQWQRIGGQCSKCTHQGWLNRYELAKAFGSAPLVSLQPLLRCTRCDTKGDHKFILGMMARD